jgi:hypothetical protein
MRMMMIAHIDTEAGNAAVRDGSLGTFIQKMIEDLKPEASYFVADDYGRRTAYVVFDMKQSSDIPGIAEPLFLKFNAEVTFRPVMNIQDLMAAGPGFEKALKG